MAQEMRVELIGLERNVELNGKIATVVDYETKNDRFIVCNYPRTDYNIYITNNEGVQNANIKILTIIQHTKTSTTMGI